MRRFTCTYEQCRELQRRVNGTFYLYPDWNKNQKTKYVLIGRKMPNGRVFIGYGREIEMYEPGEYKFMYHYPRTEDEEDHNDAQTVTQSIHRHRAGS